MYSEPELIENLKRKDEKAFRYLVETHQRQVYNTVLALVQNAEEAEDVAQEVFVEVYETIDRFRGEAALRTWLYRIATSNALKVIQKRKAKKRFAFFTSLFGSDNQVNYHPPDFHHPGVALEDREQMQLLFGAIGRLPDKQKVAFTLHYLDGLSYQEIADVQQLTVSAVESLIHRARQNLKKKLSGSL
ncbi:RNA polymerase sigma factor [Larkinella soli]|uniref:RNA polymerase sigma factor n=1 Tax=Larkinella soli TaxID=1770527 RepID=UPI000FFC8269|nr:RNA polymerase sigma factor [Larkinella soli]